MLRKVSKLQEEENFTPLSNALLYIIYELLFFFFLSLVGIYINFFFVYDFSVSLQDIHMRKAFKSTVVFDQQVVSRDTMPTAMLETYQGCDTPPPLDKLNVYR